ncbi:hypothetical protein H2200_010280 [Cladophialophora chaetospira]|uniref:Methyltransferase n=1 Tax=Cladophialophora chaetospira TaxID=386627 RepID=A0AA38X154_9EURO|nr:hypothetical protein H2200_010280 [Cladophialophora chaetospira]
MSSAGDHDVCLNFMKWHEGLALERPYQLVSEDLPDLYGIPRQNFEIAPSAEPLKIRNIRRIYRDDFTAPFDLDRNGFKYVRWEFDDVDFLVEEDVESRYKPAVEKLLRENVAGCDEVCFFQWRLRENRRAPTTDKLGNIHIPTELLVPAHFVHLDQTLKTAIEYAEEYMPPESSSRWPLGQGRLRIFNVWKPLDNPVYDCPLAVCDGSSINRASDLIVCDNVTKARVGELILPLYNPRAEWWYLSEQTPNEVVIMKIVDSAQDEDEIRASCCPHTAFDVPGFDPNSPPRRSIEMRALVFTRPKRA